MGAEHKGCGEVALNKGEAFFDVIAKSFEEESVSGHCRRDAGSAAAQKRAIENFQKITHFRSLVLHPSLRRPVRIIIRHADP
jgi:hypothetical protein